MLEKHKDDLMDEILDALFCKVEAIVNSHPITKANNDIEDGDSLSPSQLLMFHEGPVYFDKIVKKSHILNKRWRFIQYLANQFWKKWLKLYLPKLQKSNKWQNEKKSVEVGDLVLLFEENRPVTYGL